MGKKKKTLCFLLLTMPIFAMLCSETVSAGSDELDNEKIVTILYKCRSVFEQNSLFASMLRYLGWGIMKVLASVAGSVEGLYDTCFGFVDFTTYSQVNAYIDKYEKVWGALVCLSLFGLGLILIFWQEKRPKFVVNVMLAVLVVTSSTFLITKMNGFLSSEVRSELLDGSSSATATYELIGSNIHDLLYLDTKVGIENFNKKNEDGIKNYKITYETFNKQMFEMIKINETLDPDSYSDEMKSVLSKYLYVVPSDMSEGIHEKAEKIAGKKLPEVESESSEIKIDDTSFFLGDVYDGVAWTDLLNEFYYRYTVDWWAAYLELLSLIIVYVFMSYKVIRGIWEIAVGHLIATLYSANLAGGKKILKVLDCIKDSYIVLILTTVFIKFYLLACKFVGTMDVSGLGKGFILLFIAFAVIDGPSLVQKLTGIDAGMSDGMGKMLTMFYGTQMAGAVAGMGKNLMVGRDGHGGLFGTLAKPFSDLNGGSADPSGNVPPGGNKESAKNGGAMENNSNVPSGETDTPDSKNPPDGNENMDGRDMADRKDQMQQGGMEPPDGVSDGSMDTDGKQDQDFTQTVFDLEEDRNNQEYTGTSSDDVSGLSAPFNSDAKGTSTAPGEGNGKEDTHINSGKAEVLNGMDPASVGNDSGSYVSMDRMDQELGSLGMESSYSMEGSAFHESEVRQAGGQMFSPQYQEKSVGKESPEKISRKFTFNEEEH